MFVFALRKSVVDFALQDLTDTAVAANNTPLQSLSMRVTPVVKIARRRYRFDETRLKILENLFAVHPVVVKISQIWSLQYG